MAHWWPYSVGTIVGVCPKSASTSVSNTLHVPGLQPITALAVRELKKSGWRVFGLLRDPVDRLESAYNFFKYGQSSGFPTGAYSCIDEFVDAVLRGVSNDHWDQQTDQLVLCDSFADIETFPLVVHQNACNHSEHIEYRLGEIIEWYAGDMQERGKSWQ